MIMSIRIKQSAFWVISNSSYAAHNIPNKMMMINRGQKKKVVAVWRQKVTVASGGGGGAESSSPNAASVEEVVNSSRRFAGHDDEYAVDGKFTASRVLKHQPPLLGECESFKSVSSSETKSVRNDSASRQPGSSNKCKRNEEISPRVGGCKMKTRIEHSTSDHVRNFEATRYSMKGNPSGDISRGPNKVRPFDICPPHGRYSLRPDAYSPERDRLDDVVQTMEELGQVLRPGMVLLKKYVPIPKQVRIVKECRELGVSLGGFYRPSFPNGAKMCLQMMCLGMNWDPVTGKYQDQRSFDGSKPPDVPHILKQLVKEAIEDAHKLISEDTPVKNPRDVLPVMFPDICIVNFYTTWGKLGFHQDRDESRDSIIKGLPVVSLSIGDSAEFLYGDTRNVEEAERIVLESGDVLIFGGEARMVYHGVSSIYPNSAPKALLDETGLRPGRLNLTFRQF